MAFKDLREFIGKIEETGDLIRITDEVDWNLEAGAITRKGNERVGPAILFEKIKDYPQGFRILGGTLASFRRLAVAMGLKAEASHSEILEEFIQRTKNPIKPTLLTSGPCKENILKGDDVDLFMFPAPFVRDMDEVMHAFATKCHPSRGTFVQEKFTSSPITGFLWPDERNIQTGSAVVYDCTWPAEWPLEAVPLRSSFKTIYPQNVQERALEKLEKFGFKG